MSIRFISFPQTSPPPNFIPSLVEVFKAHESFVGSPAGRLDSDGVLHVVADDLVQIGWQVEASKRKDSLINRPVFFGENGVPTRTYKVDAYHSENKCGLEIEAGRAWMGNAFYRDLILAMMMVSVDHLVIAVRNEYVYSSSGKETVSRDFDQTKSVAEALYGHDRLKMPYGLTLIGY